MKIFIFIIMLMQIGSVYAEKTGTTITNLEGVSLSVELIKVEEEVVICKRIDNGKLYTIKLSSLDEESNDMLNEWKTANPEGALSTSFDISTKMIRSNRKSKGRYYDRDDDRRVRVTPDIEIQNSNLKIHSEPVKALLIVFGKPVLDKGTLKVVLKEQLDVPSLPPLAKHKPLFSSVRLLYDNKNYYRYGEKYYGFAFYILKGDEVLLHECHPRPLEDRDAKLVMSVSTGRYYDKDFRPVK